MEFTFADPWRDLVVIGTLVALCVAAFAARECYHSRAIVRLLPVTAAEADAAEVALRSQRIRIGELLLLFGLSLNLIRKHHGMLSTDLFLGPLAALILLNSVLVLRSRKHWQHYFEQYPAQDDRLEPER